jgi:hypothetical protein
MSDVHGDARRRGRSPWVAVGGRESSTEQEVEF